jgi:antitoxin component of MazEF toxin-antitoxin module
LPIIRKLIKFNTSKAICLPKSWLENAEQEAGQKIVAVALEVNGSITIMPVFEKDQRATAQTAKQEATTQH